MDSTLKLNFVSKAVRLFRYDFSIIRGRYAALIAVIYRRLKSTDSILQLSITWNRDKERFPDF